MLLRAILVCLCLAAVAAFDSPARADDEWSSDVQIIADTEMEELRGGFEINGIEIGFGALVTSYVNGQPVLTTQLTWTDAGAIVNDTVSGLGQRLNDMPANARAALGLDGLEDAEGVVIEDSAGVTALVHNIADGALQSIIINNASDRTLSQDIDVTLTLPGFDATQGALQLERFGIRLEDDMREISGRAD